MDGKNLAAIGLAVCITLAGCSRTVDDVERWESKNKIEKLKGALTDPKMEVRQAAAEALGHLKTESAVDDLAARINDQEPDVMLAALDALISIGGTPVATPLIAALNLNNETARLKAAAALGTMKVQGAIPSLAGLLDDISTSVRLTAIEAIGQIGSETGSPPLIKKLETDDVPLEIRLACIEALGRIGGSEAVHCLLATLLSPDNPVKQAARDSLDGMGPAADTVALEALRSVDGTTRAGAIALLQTHEMVPSEADDLWYHLARASLTNIPENRDRVFSLMDDRAAYTIPTLIDAACHPDAVIRETACQALEMIGEPALDQIVARVERVARPAARSWFEARSTWSGAPSTYLDLFGAVSALNPKFISPSEKRESKASDSQERSFIPRTINQLGNVQYREQTEAGLRACGIKALLPLMAALQDPEEAVVATAAALLGELGDARAVDPLLQALQKNLDAGVPLDTSPIYVALVKLDSMKAEPALMKIRPNTDRAKQLFRRRYPETKVTAAMPSGPAQDEATITINVGYELNGKFGSIDITFAQDAEGNWMPAPALPDQLP